MRPNKKETKELAWLECQANFVFIMKKLKYLFCGMSFTGYYLKVTKHEKRYIPVVGTSVSGPF